MTDPEACELYVLNSHSQQTNHYLPGARASPQKRDWLSPGQVAHSWSNKLRLGGLGCVVGKNGYGGSWGKCEVQEEMGSYAGQLSKTWFLALHNYKWPKFPEIIKLKFWQIPNLFACQSSFWFCEASSTYFTSSPLSTLLCE